MGSMFLQVLCILGVLFLMHGAFAQDNNCSIAVLAPLSPCLPYIQAGNTTKPASDCCDPLGSLLTSGDPTCLCQIGPLAQQSGISINQTRALEVLSSCNQTLPSSITSCLSGVASVPLGAPSATPTSPTSTTPPPQAGGNTSPSLGSALLPPSFLLISSIFVVFSMHIGIIST